MNDFTVLENEKKEIPQIKTEAPGLYIGMSEKAYHADKSLSASGIVDLTTSPQTYYRNSPHNPDRKEDETPQTTLGKWFHLVVNGDHTDNRAFVVKPEGMSFATKNGKAWRAENATDETQFISADTNQTVLKMVDALHMSGALDGHETFLSEVSYFWIGKDGIPRKIRIDRLSTTGAIDFKTFSNSQRKDEETLLAHTIAYESHHIKAAFYMEGIAHMFDALKAGKLAIYGDDPGEVMNQIEQQDTLPFWYIYIESDPIPIIFKRRFSKYDESAAINGYWMHATHEIERALRSYRARAIRHGFDTPWIDRAYAKPIADVDLERARWIVERD